jgi:hypothetical protein
MNRKAPTALIAGALLACSLPCAADSTRARCDIYPKGSDVNATVGEVSAELNGDLWTVTRDNGEVYEVPLSAIEGG